MSDLQSDLLNYHDDIKLGVYDEDHTLREKRDLLVNELKGSLRDEKVPGTEKKLTFSKIDQGSYAMRTGIKPEKEGQYDIDVGVIFDVTPEEYDALDLKKLVRDKLKRNNRTVEFNRPCITVTYAEGYHVDLPVYATSEDGTFLSWGKEFSQNNEWQQSAPQELKDWVSSVSDDEESRKQFRRCVRYLKRWKIEHFSSNGNARPPSIGLTIQSREHFIFFENDDLAALINICRNIKSDFVLKYCEADSCLYNTISFNLPVVPYKNVYEKMSEKQKDNFYIKLEDLIELLESAQTEESKHEASKYLNKALGNFPISEDVVKTKRAPYVATGNSA